MSREYPAWPIVGIGGVVVHGGRALLVRRGGPPLQGEWSIPGGALEVGETLHAGLRREMREETGLDVEPIEVLEVLDRIIRDEQGRVRYHYVLIDYLCATTSGQASAASDAEECRWVRRDELPGFQLRPETLRVLQKAFVRTGER
jgi:ADP-ribose pyrophosphatase YjhB (NUDIX family)